MSKVCAYETRVVACSWCKLKPHFPLNLRLRLNVGRKWQLICPHVLISFFSQMSKPIV